ncbi:putative bifunctional diguanylate cyclase/phosphodiesterase [Salinispira pacifica]|nr:bifunctional diguanylate cyclase/phosphodiesterase [Salinispira pacifica]
MNLFQRFAFSVQRFLRYQGLSSALPLFIRGKILLIHIMAFLGLVIFLPLAISVAAAGSYLASAVLIFATTGQIAAMIIYHRGNRLDASIQISALSVILALTYAMITGGYNGYGILYIFLGPIILFYFLNIRWALFTQTLFALLFVFAIAFPTAPIRAHLEADFLLRVFVLYILISSLTGSVVFGFKQTTSRLEAVAYYDDLTGLPNRHYIRTLLNETARRSRKKGTPFFTLFISIHRFRQINDNYGYTAGDEMLRLFARRCETLIPKDGFLGRFGGTDFILSFPSDDPDPKAVAEMLHQSALKGFILMNQLIRLSLNISYTAYLSHLPNELSQTSDHEGPGRGRKSRSRFSGSRVGTDPAESIIRNLELALSVSKSRGGGTTIRYDKQGHEDIRKRYRLAEELRSAVSRQELTLHFQPIIRADSRKVTKVEALARWFSPEFGEVSPEEFIPLAEEIGIIAELSEYLFHIAASDIQELRELNHGNENRLALSFNISPVNLHSQNFIPVISNILAKTAADMSQLELEITESMLIEDNEMVKQNLTLLKNMGIRLSLDDFGTGYSSLSYLHRFNIDTLKIDRSFIASMQESTHSREIIRAIQAMALSLGMETVAEGVEYEEQDRMLRELEVTHIQGFLHARPMDRTALQVWMKHWNTVHFERRNG